MEINPIQPDPVDPNRRREVPRPAAPDAKPPAGPKDRVEVSDSVEQLAHVAKRLRENLNQINERRTELLRAVQEMLADGSIDDEQVLAETAEAMLREES